MHLICASSPRPPSPHLPNPNCANCVIPGRNEKTKVVQNWGDVQGTKYLPYRSIVGYIILVLIYGLFVFLLFRFAFVFVCLLYLLSFFFFTYICVLFRLVCSTTPMKVTRNLQLKCLKINPGAFLVETSNQPIKTGVMR